MSDDHSLENSCRELATRAKAASYELATATGQQKNDWLKACAQSLKNHSAEILRANAHDTAAAPQFGLDPAAIDRLKLTSARIDAMIEGLHQVAALPDPVGEILEGSRRPNGLEIQKVSTPLGVIFFLYESRPNVTADAAALCVKSGNAVILRGGKEAFHTNQTLHRLLTEPLAAHGLPPHAVQLVPTLDRDAVGHFLRLPELIDLVIPRGGESLIRRVMAEAQMPVLKHYQGNCHIFVDTSADLAYAEAIIVNAKCQRPGVCNALESLLIHELIAPLFLPNLVNTLVAAGVEVRGCDASRQIVPTIIPATDADYRAEYLSLVLSLKIVPTVNAAIGHINAYGSKHTDAILTQDLRAAQMFTQQVDSAAVVVNASTRFNDGFEIGLGAEIGISTDKFHARGPCGLRELTTYKYIITGTGQIRT